MNKNNLFGIGIVFAMLLVFTAPAAAADNTVYFDPDPSCAAPGEEITVTLWLNSSSNCNSWNHDLYFDPNVVDIIDGQPGDFPTMFGFTNWGHFVRVGGISPDWGDYPPGQYILATYTMKANSSGTGIGTFHHTANALGDEYGHDLPNQVWVDGTFNNPCPVPTTYAKELAPGWNLISLPLTPIDSSTDAVLGNDTIAYNAVYRYNATSKDFECPSTMDTGIGYFVYVTTAGIWEYEGMPVSSTSPDLVSGLNMIGFPNCTMSVSDAMGSADYRYVARWNAVDQEFEVYNPSAPVAFHHFDTMEAGEGYFVSAK